MVDVRVEVLREPMQCIAQILFETVFTQSCAVIRQAKLFSADASNVLSLWTFLRHLAEDYSTCRKLARLFNATAWSGDASYL